MIYFEYTCVNPKCESHREEMRAAEKVDMDCPSCKNPMRRVVREGDDEA